MRTPYEYYFINELGGKTETCIIWLDSFEVNHIGQVMKRLLTLDGVGYSNIVMKKIKIQPVSFPEISR